MKIRDTWTGLTLTALFALIVIGFEVAGFPIWSRILRDVGLR